MFGSNFSNFFFLHFQPTGNKGTGLLRGRADTELTGKREKTFFPEGTLRASILPIIP
jgi:hypothetical protein